MLFHIAHTHDPSACLFGDPKRLAGTFGKVDEAMATAGATVIGSWVNPAAHTFYWVVEADAASTLTRGLAPVVELGRADINPVADLAQTLRALLEG